MENNDFPFTPAMIHDGMQIDHYEIITKVGIGGMGAVYKAFDTLLKRTVAIKFMLNGKETIYQKRFVREIDVSARFDHPYIVKVFNSGSFNQFPYLVMEYVDGQSLQTYLVENKPSLNQKLSIMAKVANAVDYAHRQNIIHRDIKPANIMIRQNGEPVLMDFGLARVTHIKDRSLTQSGEVIGTLEYMSPEQAQGRKQEIGRQSDVYGLGAVLYYLLTGSPPVTGENFIEKVCKVVEQNPVMPSFIHPDIPKRVEKICIRALEKKKHRRYACAKDYEADIYAYLEGKATKSEQFYQRRRIFKVFLAITIVVLLCIVAAGIRYFSSKEDDNREKMAFNSRSDSDSRKAGNDSKKQNDNPPNPSTESLESEKKIAATNHGKNLEGKDSETSTKNGKRIENYVLNGGFEDADTSIPPKWHKCSSDTESAGPEKASFVWDRSVAHTGKRSMYIKVRDKKRNGVGQALEIAKLGLSKFNKITGTLTGYIKSRESVNAYFSIDCIDKNTDSYFSQDTEPVGENAGWIEHRTTMEIPAGTTKIEIHGGLDGPGEAWFDDVSLLIVSDGIKRDNLLENKSFEEEVPITHPKAWLPMEHSSSFSLDSEIKHGGKYSLRISGSEPCEIFQTLSPQPTLSERKMVIQGYIKTRGKGNSPSATFGLGWYNKKAKRSVLTQMVCGDTDWTFVRETIKIPKEGGNIFVVLETESNSPSEAWFDDIRITSGE